MFSITSIQVNNYEKVMLTSSFLTLIFVAMPQAHFLLRNTKKTEWNSWQQHVACQTTCVPGYEMQTRDCCMTGDNRLCFDLPWSLLNTSVGKCEEFSSTTPDTVASQNASVSTTRPTNYSDQPLQSTQPTQDLIKLSELSTENSNLATKPSSTLTHSDPPTMSFITDISSTVMASSALSQGTPQSSVAFVTSKSTDGGLIVPTKSSTPKPTAPSYCQNKQSISCGFQFTVVCGSDGKYYANQCMLALGRCDDPTLHLRENSFCASHG